MPAPAPDLDKIIVLVTGGEVTLFQGCATKRSMYDDVQRSTQLNGAFDSSVQKLANLHITP